MRTIRFPKRLTDEAKAQSVLYPDTGLEVAVTDESARSLERAQDQVYGMFLVDSIFGDIGKGLYSK